MTGHPKDWPNSRTNSLQPGKNDVDQIEFRSLSVTALDLVIECMIERPPALDRTNDCDQSHQFEDSLLERPLKAITHMIEHPPVLNRTCVCARAHTGLYVNFLRFSY